MNRETSHPAGGIGFASRPVAEADHFAVHHQLQARLRRAGSATDQERQISPLDGEWGGGQRARPRVLLLDRAARRRGVAVDHPQTLAANVPCRPGSGRSRPARAERRSLGRPALIAIGFEFGEHDIRLPPLLPAWFGSAEAISRVTPGSPTIWLRRRPATSAALSEPDRVRQPAAQLALDLASDSLVIV